MTDAAGPARALRVSRFRWMQGANWIAPRSVLAALVEGDFAADGWPGVPGLLAPLLPAGLPDVPFPPTPATPAAAVESLARFLLAVVEIPTAAVPRTTAGRGAAHVATIATGHFTLAASAMEAAGVLLDQAGLRQTPTAAWTAAATERLRRLRADAEAWMPLTRRFIAWAAEARGIPCRTVHGAPQMFLLGEGRHARRFNASSTAGTGVIASTLAANKRTGHAVLLDAGLPVPGQALVRGADEVRTAIARFGLPVVVKPVGLRIGEGMTVVFRPGDVDEAWANASRFGQPVVAESYIPGNEYRVLVIGGEMVAALMRQPPVVTGDGRRTIRELIEALNTDPMRGEEAEGFPRPHLVIDDPARRFLESRGLSHDSVPRSGETVQVHPSPMRRVGGRGRIDVTGLVHPDNRAMAVRAVAALGLDVAGIDLRMPDIARSWREVGAGICEVNPQPNLKLHYGIGSDLDVAGILIDRCYPPAERGPMRHVLLVSDDELSAHLAAVAGALRRRFGWRVGTVGGAGVDLDGWTPGRAATSLPDAYGLVVSDPTLDAAVYAVRPDRLADSGLGAQRLDAAFFGTGTEPAIGLARAVAEGLGQPRLPLPARPEETAAVAVARLERAIAGG